MNTTFFSSKLAKAVFDGCTFKMAKPTETTYIKTEALGSLHWRCLCSNGVGRCFGGDRWLKRNWDTLHRLENRHALSSLNERVDAIINSAKEF